jgi:beta-glucanase (GH16 family)
MFHRLKVGQLTYMRRTGLLIAVVSALGVAWPASAATPTCGGETPPPKLDGGQWTCTFDDEFDATTGDAAALNPLWWTPQTTAASGFTQGYPYVACYVDSPNNISVSDGALHLTVRDEGQQFDCSGVKTQYTSGMVISQNHFSQTYGRFEVRAKLPDVTVPGLQETLWLWPDDATRYGSWPASGEVDFAEFYSQYYNLVVPYLHYDYDSSTTNSTTDTNEVTNYCPIDISQYNDYAVTWRPGTFEITVNGTQCLVDNYQPSNVSSPAPFDQPFFIALTQALGVGTNAYDPSSTPLPSTTSIDYVRVWK